METKERTDSALRAAFEYLRRSRKTVLRVVSDAVGCSRRHLQAVVSSSESKPMSGELAHKIAGFYGLDYQHFLDLGERILAGEDGGAALAEIRSRVPARQALHLLRGAAEAVGNVEPAELPDRSRRVPVVSLVRAGAWTEAEAVEPSWAEEWIEAPSRVGARAFALRVKGDSMEPVFREGEVVVVDPDIEAANGDYVVAALEREEATLKRYMREGGRDWLIPLNARYDPIEMTGRDWRVIGRVQMKLMEF